MVLNLPDDANILCVQIQNNFPYIWAITKRGEEPNTNRVFKVYGTGHSLPDFPGNYIGTFQMNGGTFVFHIFEEPTNVSS